MPTIEPILPEHASPKSRQLLEVTERRIGRSSTMLRTLAHSPAILETYLHFNHAFEETKMSAKLRGLLTIAIAQVMGCDYTLSVALALGAREGLSVEELEAARHGESEDPKTALALRFAMRVVEEHGEIDPSLVTALEQVGFSDEERVEIIGAIGLNLFRNYFNLIARTEVDFPRLRASEPIPLAVARQAVFAGQRHGDALPNPSKERNAQ